MLTLSRKLDECKPLVLGTVAMHVRRHNLEAPQPDAAGALFGGFGRGFGFGDEGSDEDWSEGQEAEDDERRERGGRGTRERGYWKDDEDDYDVMLSYKGGGGGGGGGDGGGEVVSEQQAVGPDR